MTPTPEDLALDVPELPELEKTNEDKKEKKDDV